MSDELEDETEEGIVSLDDLIALGQQVTTMADRLKPIHAAVPGAQATYKFSLDDVTFKLVMTIED